MIDTLPALVACKLVRGTSIGNPAKGYLPNHRRQIDIAESDRSICAQNEIKTIYG